MTSWAASRDSSGQAAMMLAAEGAMIVVAAAMGGPPFCGGGWLGLPAPCAMARAPPISVADRGSETTPLLDARRDIAISARRARFQCICNALRAQGARDCPLIHREPLDERA